MRPGYTSRSLRAGISRYTVPEPPAPTRADLESSLFRQVWKSVTGQARYEILLLALDHAHAHAAGAARMERTYGAGALGELRLVESRQIEAGPLAYDTLRPLLEADSQDEKDARRHAWEATPDRVTP